MGCRRVSGRLALYLQPQSTYEAIYPTNLILLMTEVLCQGRDEVEGFLRHLLEILSLSEIWWCSGAGIYNVGALIIRIGFSGPL